MQISFAMGLVGLLRSFGGMRTYVLVMSIVCNVCIRRVECPVFLLRLQVVYRLEHRRVLPTV